MGFSTTRRGALGAAALIGAGGSAARTPQQADEGGWALPYSTVVPLTSAINGVDYALYVRPPLGYAPEKGPYPVVLTLDADYSFPIASKQMENLAFGANQAPHVIVVSVAHAGIYPDPSLYRTERARDFTPVAVHTDGPGQPTPVASGGGGPAFLRVLTEEVLPLIHSRWAADPDDRTLVGHSFGGLFASWVLQSQPEAFMRYLIVSPSLWYAQQLILKREAEGGFAPLPRKTYAYIGIGDQEERSDRGLHMVTEMQRFAALLTARSDPNLIVRSRVFEDETHASIFPACFSTGIRHLFRTM